MDIILDPGQEAIHWDKYIVDSLLLLNKAYPNRTIPEDVMPVVLMRELYQFFLHEEFGIPAERFHVVQGFSYGLDDRRMNIEYRGVGNLAEKLRTRRKLYLFDDIRESGQTFGKFGEIKEISDMLKNIDIEYYAKYEKAAGNEWDIKLSACIKDKIEEWLIRPFDKQVPIIEVYRMLSESISPEHSAFGEVLGKWRDRIRKSYDLAEQVMAQTKPDMIISTLYGSMEMIALCHILERRSYEMPDDNQRSNPPEHDYYYINDESNFPELEELIKEKRKNGIKNIILLRGADEPRIEDKLATVIGDFFIPESGNLRRITSVNRKIFA